MVMSMMGRSNGAEWHLNDGVVNNCMEGGIFQVSFFGGILLCALAASLMVHV